MLQTASPIMEDGIEEYAVAGNGSTSGVELKPLTDMYTIKCRLQGAVCA